MHMLLGWLMPLLAPWPYCAQVRYRRGLRHVDGVRLEPLTNPSPPPACSHVQAELWPSNHAETLPMEAPCFLLTSVQTFKIRVCLQKKRQMAKYGPPERVGLGVWWWRTAGTLPGPTCTWRHQRFAAHCRSASALAACAHLSAS